jgi:hypothetical protein
VIAPVIILEVLILLSTMFKVETESLYIFDYVTYAAPIFSSVTYPESILALVTALSLILEVEIVILST